jgi:hypothetical protein
MLDRRFTALFILVTGLLAAAIYVFNQAATRGGVLLTILAAAAAIVGILGFIVLARVVVVDERQRRAR